jgi:hypothetical protein
LDKHTKLFKNAGIAQLVERNLAKVEVASSSLVSRSSLKKGKQSFPFLSVGQQEFQQFLPAAR